MLFKEIFINHCCIYLFFTDWLCGLALRLKDQNLNHLWTRLICSKFWLPCQVHFFGDVYFVCRILYLHFHHPRLWLPPQVAQKIQKQSIQQKMVEIGWLQVESVLLGTLNWTTTSLLGLFLSSSFSSLYFVFNGTSLCFLFVAILRRTHQQLSCMQQTSKQSNLKTAERLKTFELVNLTMISSRFRSPWHHPRQEGKNSSLNLNSNYIIKNGPMDQIFCSI